VNCPACARELNPMTAGGVTVDVCDGGCGGLWLDKRELDHFDEPHESAGEALLAVHRGAGVTVDLDRRPTCPHCEGIVLMRHFFSPRFELEVDACPSCGGFWLDHGELGRIREQFDDDEQRREATERFLAENLAPHLDRMRTESSAQEHKARRIANLFRFFCPSAWLPGKQSWGSF